MKLYLSRQQNGLYMLTKLMPTKAALGLTGLDDVYVTPGDPLQVKHLCPVASKALFGIELEPLQVIRINLTSVTINDNPQ